MQRRRVEIEGGTEEQRRLLAEVVAGLGDTRLELLRLAPWTDHGEGDERRTPEQVEASRGTGVRLVRPAPADLRTEWELSIAARAFAERSDEEELERVVWVGSPDGGYPLGFSGRGPDLSVEDVRALERVVSQAAAAARADIERFDILRPRVYAWALTLRIDEPHDFLRHRLGSLLEAIEPWRHGRDAYLEIRDDGAYPVKIQTRSGWGASAMTRPDVACCDPTPSFGRGIADPGPPPCPVFG